MAIREQLECRSHVSQCFTSVPTLGVMIGKSAIDLCDRILLMGRLQAAFEARCRIRPRSGR
ncbi:hypothetical protein AKJ13_23260 [Methylobacterium sp. ARG-1]|nr:hypothetical protein AKJ13_23260 [Methylobacterium sp. ARG-1]